MIDKPLTMYVVYDHPIDHPNDVIVRRWKVLAGGVVEPGPIVAVARSVDQARVVLSQIPGLVRTAPHELDDPKIAEVWL